MKSGYNLIRGDVVKFAGDRWEIIKILEDKQYVLRHCQRRSKTTVTAREKCVLIG